VNDGPSHSENPNFERDAENAKRAEKTGTEKVTRDGVTRKIDHDPVLGRTTSYTYGSRTRPGANRKKRGRK
jgi:hypothetical protein